MEPKVAITPRRNLKISILIPCYNEEKMIKQCVESCLNQSLMPDQVVIVDDFSSDRSPRILARLAIKYPERIKIFRTPKNTGNKSRAQEYGLRFITGTIVITTDADSILDHHFVREIVKDFDDPKVFAVGGYVRSIKYNCITLCRAFDYVIGQNIHKLAQSYMNFMFVIPGVAGAFRTEAFRSYLTFEHDTIAEDLDFTYKLHKLGLKISYNRKAIANTQDPMTISSYTNQVRRWIGGGWQCLIKHYDIIWRPSRALEISLMYIEGVVFAALLFLIPIINLRVALLLLIPFLIISMTFSIYVALKEKQPRFLLVPFFHLLLLYLNSYILLEQFFLEVVLRRKSLIWFKPDRVRL